LLRIVFKFSDWGTRTPWNPGYALDKRGTSIGYNYY